jgi:hypothetical protein
MIVFSDRPRIKSWYAFPERANDGLLANLSPSWAASSTRALTSLPGRGDTCTNISGITATMKAHGSSI